jgi:AcrR family transcriptional regulator
MAVRVSRAAQVELNRDRVLEAARRVFLARGYGGATIDAITEEAGFSKGVVYSQFSSKADLFLALLRQRVETLADQNDRIVRDRAGLDAMLALIRAGEQRARDQAGWARLLIEFRLVAARDPELNRRYAATHEQTVTRLAAALERAVGTWRSPLPSRLMAQLTLALASGLTLERAADPTALPASEMESVLTGLLRATSVITEE